MKNLDVRNPTHTDRYFRLSALTFFLLCFSVKLRRRTSCCSTRGGCDDRLPLSDLIAQEEYWEGSPTEFKETFYNKEDGFEEIFCRKEGEAPSAA